MEEEAEQKSEGEGKGLFEQNIFRSHCTGGSYSGLMLVTRQWRISDDRQVEANMIDASASGANGH